MTLSVCSIYYITEFAHFDTTNSFIHSKGTQYLLCFSASFARPRPLILPYLITPRDFQVWSSLIHSIICFLPALYLQRRRSHPALPLPRRSPQRPALVYIILNTQSTVPSQIEIMCKMRIHHSKSAWPCSRTQ